MVAEAGNMRHRFAYDAPALSREANASGVLMAFVNCRLVRGDKVVQEDLWVENGRIVSGEDVFYAQRRTADVEVDCAGHHLCAGFVELQINGGWGVDFTSAALSQTDAEYDSSLALVARRLLAHGVTSFAPTVVSSRPEVYASVCHRLAPREGCAQRGAAVLGAHLEGPFINMERRGAHDPANVVDSRVDIDAVYGWHSVAPHVAMVTLAPELPGAIEAVERMAATCAVCLGHTSTRLATAESAVVAGARGVTHLFNAMAPYHHRDPTLLGLLASERIPAPVHYGIIADGLHTHDSALRIAYRTHPAGLVLVSDAISALGMGDGKHQLGTATVQVQGNKAELVDAPGTPLAGSATPIDQCVRHFKQAVGCSVAEAVACATEHPARLLDRQRDIGTVAPGGRADFVVLDDDLNVKATFIAGRLVWPLEEAVA